VFAYIPTNVISITAAISTSTPTSSTAACAGVKFGISVSRVGGNAREGD